jgi:hypothetical protein
MHLHIFYRIRLHLRDVRLVLGSEQHRLCRDAAVALVHFLRHSQSHRTLTIVEEEQDDSAASTKRTDNSINTSILLHSMAHGHYFTKLTLVDMHMERPCFSETFLSTTHTQTQSLYMRARNA